MVFEKVQNIIVDILAVDEEEITMDSSLESDLEADSLDIVEIITAVEDEFQIEIPDEDLQKMAKVSDLVEYIESK
ncbi:MAG: acyl carrier protein [Firmicutes bacterium]|nr:acyl carrier protein [Bacillota bacterium]